MNGQGRFEGADGTLYVGDWFNGNMDGKGDLREANVRRHIFVYAYLCMYALGYVSVYVLVQWKYGWQGRPLSGECKGSMFANMHTYIHTYRVITTLVGLWHIYIYIYIYICIYIYIHTHTHTYIQGDHYVGRFMAGRKNGPGTFFHHGSGISYTCDWTNDM